MQERGFDQLANMPALLFGSTILLLLIIFVGGMWLRKKEMDWREKNEPRDPKG